MKDVRVPDSQEDSLDMKLEASYDHHNTFGTDKAGTVVNAATIERVSSPKNSQNFSVTDQGGTRKVVHDSSVKFFGKECDHGDTHSQLTNGGFARKPNGGGFYCN